MRNTTPIVYSLQLSLVGHPWVLRNVINIVFRFCRHEIKLFLEGSLICGWIKTNMISRISRKRSSIEGLAVQFSIWLHKLVSKLSGSHWPIGSILAFCYHFPFIVDINIFSGVLPHEFDKTSKWVYTTMSLNGLLKSLVRSKIYNMNKYFLYLWGWGFVMAFCKGAIPLSGEVE